MQTRCLVVDDDELTCMLFSSYVKKTPGLLLLGSYTDSQKALDYLLQNPVDILFLDIQMPDITGMDIVRALPFPPYIVLITSAPEFAAESYRLNVADYLVKPVNTMQFAQAVRKALNLLEERSRTNMTNTAVPREDFVFLKIDNKYTKVLYSDIVYVEADKDYTRVFTPTHVLISSVNLKTLEEALPGQQFVRTHRSYLVNISYIQSIEADQVNTLKYQIPMGPSYKDTVIEKTVNGKLIR